MLYPKTGVPTEPTSQSNMNDDEEVEEVQFFMEGSLSLRDATLRA